MTHTKEELEGFYKEWVKVEVRPKYEMASKVFTDEQKDMTEDYPSVLNAILVNSIQPLYYWLQDLEKLKSIKGNVEGGMRVFDIGKWKYFEDNNKYWTKDMSSGIEQSIGPKKEDGGFYYLEKDGNNKKWGDVVTLDTTDKKATVKMREESK